MENIRDDKKPEREKLTSETAIRCAKAALLLSSLRNSTYDSTANNISELQIEQKIKMEKLQLKLMMKKLGKEERKLRRLIWAGMLLYFVCFPFFVLLRALDRL